MFPTKLEAFRRDWLLSLLYCTVSSFSTQNKYFHAVSRTACCLKFSHDFLLSDGDASQPLSHFHTVLHINEEIMHRRKDTKEEKRTNPAEEVSLFSVKNTRIY